MVLGVMKLLGYCKVLRKRTPGTHNRIITCLGEKAKPPKGGGAKQQGLQLNSISQDSLLPNQQFRSFSTDRSAG